MLMKGIWSMESGIWSTEISTLEANSMIKKVADLPEVQLPDESWTKWSHFKPDIYGGETVGWQATILGINYLIVND
jgi:hypothetical protein